jgi:hypothetical protein
VTTAGNEGRICFYQYGAANINDWRELRSIDGTVQDGNFGRAVAISGDGFLVASSFGNSLFGDPGTVEVYEYILFDNSQDIPEYTFAVRGESIVGGYISDEFGSCKNVFQYE